MLLRLLAAVFIAGAAAGPSASAAGEWIPLVKGNYWVYRGPTKWLEYNAQKDEKVAKERVLTCRAEITEIVHRGAVTAAVLEGFPSDYSWYNPAQPSQRHLIVRIGAGTYYLFEGKEEMEKALAQVRALDADGGVYNGWLKEVETWLDAPLALNKRYGDPAQLARGWYCWHVEKEDAFNGGAVRGLPPGKSTVYTVAYRTNPDHTVMEIVRGVGLVSYTYVHHGTLASTDLRLVEAKLRPEMQE